MKRALVVVDVQNDFCEGGSLAVTGGAAVATAITKHIAAHPGDYAHVVGTRDWHVAPGAHFAADPDFRDSWPAHCVVGTSGADFHTNFDASGLDAEFRKGMYAAAYSGFEGVTDGDVTLSEWLHQRDISDIDVVGIATDYCVRATALDAVRNGFSTNVLVDLTAGVASETTEAAKSELANAGVQLSTS